MNDILLNVFDETMNREKKEAKILSSGDKFNCFFRKLNDNSNIKDTVLMYYSSSLNIKQGTLIQIKNQTYIALNCETIENDVYKKSAMVHTNGTINTNNFLVEELPFYGGNINDATEDTGNNLSIIGGNIEIITEDNFKSRKLEINDEFNEWGRTWRITNIFYIDGFCHLVVEVTNDKEIERTYHLEIPNLTITNVSPGDSANIKSSAYVNDTIINATITYKSSNEKVATVTNDGIVEFLADGQVFFTILWEEQNISKNTPIITVMSAATDDNVSLYVQSLPEICFDFEEDIDYYVLKGGIKVSDIPVYARVEGLSDAFLKKINVDIKEKIITIIVSGSVMLDKEFDLIIYNNNYNIEHRQSIKVTSLF